jgi:hypothetical protein
VNSTAYLSTAANHQDHSKESGACDFSSAPQAREEWKEVIAMVPEFDWTKVVVTFIKSFFGFLSRKSRSRRDNGDFG